ncbi:MAG: aldo/keto reductase [Rickettsiales bacterium]
MTKYKYHLILQARLSSSRLPGKSLLSIHGISAINLIIKRLESTKYNIILALPHGQEGEIISKQLDNNNISTSFGSYNNVLARFIESTKSLDNEDIIIRCTADNLIIDNHFIEEMLPTYNDGYLYAEINNHIYGLSAEMFKVKHLREAHTNTDSDFDKEHVTPYIYKKYGKSPFQHEFTKKHKLRLTLDNYADFTNITNLFSQFDSYNTNWHTMLEKAYEIFEPNKPIIIGTAQFGMDYGINNCSGQISNDDAKNIFELAINSGIGCIDTAPSYGNAEKIISDNAGLLANTKICTKISPDTKAEEIELQIAIILKNMKRDSIDYMLLHNADQYGGIIWKKLQELKHNGLISKIGLSIYSPKQVYKIKNDVNVIQFPINILDNRWDHFLEKNKDIELHARSIFLQGLILNDNLLEQKGLTHLSFILDSLVKKHRYKNRIELCISYIKSIHQIDKIIIGIDNINHLRNNLLYFNNNILTEEDIRIIKKKFICVPENILDIRKWS